MMNDFFKVLLNIRSLRAALRELTFEQLQEIKEKLDVIYQERKDHSLKERAVEQEYQAKLEQFQTLLKDAGIDPSELISGHALTADSKVNAKQPRRAPRPAKYKYTDAGVEKTWTGQGRMPKALAKSIEMGYPLKNFLI